MTKLETIKSEIADLRQQLREKEVEADLQKKIEFEAKYNVKTGDTVSYVDLKNKHRTGVVFDYQYNPNEVYYIKVYVIGISGKVTVEEERIYFSQFHNLKKI